MSLELEKWYHKVATSALEFRKEKHVNEELETEVLRSGHGSGNTNCEKPRTLEHSQ